MIDLVEGAGRDAEAMAAEQVLDRTRAVQDLLARTEHHGAEAVVDVEYDGSDLRMQLPKLLHEGLVQRENGAHRDEHHQHLPGGKAAPHEHMPQPAGAAALVEDLDLEIRQHAADVHDDRVRRLILDEAAVHRDHGVAARLINAGDDLALRVQREGGRDLVAVMGRILHAEDRQHRAEAAQQRLRAPLFPGQLLRIGQMLELASAALLRVGTGSSARLFHNGLRTDNIPT